MKARISLIALGLIALVMAMFVGCERIDAGHVGIKVNMTGGDKGISKTEYVTGWNFYIRGASKIYEFPTYQQHVEYDPFTVSAKGGTIFTIHPSFNYSLNAGEVGNMFQQLRQPLDILEKGFIFNALRIALREATNEFTVDSMLNNVAKYDAVITEVLNEKLKPYFAVSQYTSNLTPDESLRGVLAAKSKALQEALQLENEQKKIRVQAENDIIEAKRDSTVTVVHAKAEAISIKVVNEELRQSPQFVEKIKAEKWNGVLPQYVLGNSNMFMNLKAE